MSNEDNKPTITVDDKEHIIEDMTQEQQIMVQHLLDLSNKITQASFSLDQLKVSEVAFRMRLIESLKVVEE